MATNYGQTIVRDTNQLIFCTYLILLKTCQSKQFMSLIYVFLTN